MVTMRITLPTSHPGEVYRDHGPAHAVLERLYRTCPRGGTLVEAATAARTAGTLAERGAFLVLRDAASAAEEYGDSHAATAAATLAEAIRREGLLTCYVLELCEFIAQLHNLPRRAA